MKNYLEAGETVVVAAAADTVSGAFVVKGSMSGVAQADAANGADLVLTRRGVFELPKLAAGAIAQGDKLYWDPAVGSFSKDDTKSDVNAVAFAAAVDGDATLSVLLRG